MNIAILSPSLSSYSETFIQTHRYLKGNIFFFYEGEIPKKVEGYSQSQIYSLLPRLYYKVLQILGLSDFGFDRYMLKRNLVRLDIQVGLAEYGTTGVYCFKTFKQLGIPLVVHFHGYDASSKLIRRKFKSDYPEMFHYCSAIIAVSKEMKEDVINLGANPKKVHLIPYGPANDFLNINSSPTKPFYFIHVGRFTEKKAPENTIKAFVNCLYTYPDIELVMVGDGVLLEKCKALVHSLDVNHKVKFMGKLGVTEVTKLLKHAFAFILHSVTASDGDKEGTPVSILEAMAIGLPVISTRHAGIKDVVVENQTGYLVDEHDVNGMAICMKSLLKSPEMGEKMGKNGKKRIVDHYTLEKHLNGIQKLLEKACQN